MKNYTEMSRWTRWLVGGAVAVLAIGVVSLTSNGKLFKGLVGYDGDMYSLEECTEYKALWDQGDWTDRITGSLDKPAGCATLYPDFWYGVPVDANNPTLAECQAVRNDVNMGEWTARNPGNDINRTCYRLYTDMWDTPTRESCLYYNDIWQNGEWTDRFGNSNSSNRLIDLCRSANPDLDFDQPANLELVPTEARCDELQALWNEGGWTARFGSADEPRACRDAYGFDMSGPSFAECRAAREIWGQGNWTQVYGHTGLPADCAASYPDFWYGVQENNEPGNPPAGFEDEVEVNMNPFSDVDERTPEGRAAVVLYHRGIIGGYSDGTFRGDVSVNRAEVIKFLVLALDLDVPNDFDPRDIGFWDVPFDSWYAPYVIAARDAGLIGGYADGSFHGEDSVLTAEFLTMLHRSFDIRSGLPYGFVDVEAGSYYEDAAGMADFFSLLPERGDHLRPGDEVTRGEVAYALYQFLVQGIWS